MKSIWESRLKAEKPYEIQNDTTASWWESLETFPNKLDVQFMNNGVPPRMKFSFRYLKIAPFFVLKYLRKLNKTI